MQQKYYFLKMWKQIYLCPCAQSYWFFLKLATTISEIRTFTIVGITKVNSHDYKDGHTSALESF